MKTQVLLSILAAVAVWVFRRPLEAVYLPSMVAGFLLGLTISHRPHLPFVKRGAVVAAIFALSSGVVVSLIDRSLDVVMIAVVFVLTFVMSVIGMAAAFLLKEAASHLGVL